MAECNVRYHYDVWTVPDENGDSVLARILRKLAEAQWEQEYRNAQTTRDHLILHTYQKTHS